MMIKPGDYFENCGFQPALCIHTELDEDGNLDLVHGVSLVTGSICTCAIRGCAPRKLDFETARKMRLLGPDKDYIKSIESRPPSEWDEKHRWWDSPHLTEFAEDVLGK